MQMQFLEFQKECPQQAKEEAWEESEKAKAVILASQILSESVGTIWHVCDLDGRYISTWG